MPRAIYVLKLVKYQILLSATETDMALRSRSDSSAIKITKAWEYSMHD